MVSGSTGYCWPQIRHWSAAGDEIAGRVTRSPPRGRRCRPLSRTWRALPGCTAARALATRPGDLRVIDLEVDDAPPRVDHDPIALVNEGDRPPDERLRRHVPDAVALRCAAEPAIGHEGDVRAQTGARDGRGHG